LVFDAMAKQRRLFACFFLTDKGNEIERYVGVTLFESELHFGEDDE
jgi:hypothetical protein